MQNTYTAGSGAFSFAPIVNFTTGNYDTYTAVGDIDGDGKPDIVVANTEGNNVTILKNGPIPVPPMAPTIRANGPVSFCAGGSVLLLSSDTAGNQWFVNGNAVAGATTDSLRVDTSGLYTLQVTANGVTTPADTSIMVTTSNLATPVITQKGNLLVSSATIGNQWFFNGNAIAAGDTLPTLQPAQNGSYTVVATVNGCVSSISAPFNYTASTSPTIQSYPNPITNQVTISWPSGTMPDILTVSISDLQGRPIVVVENIQSGQSIDVSALAPGMYFIKVYSGNPFKVYQTEKISKLQ